MSVEQFLLKGSSLEQISEKYSSKGKGSNAALEASFLLACALGREDVVSYFLDTVGVNILCVDSRGRFALHRAAESGDLATVKTVAEHLEKKNWLSKAIFMEDDAKRSVFDCVTNHEEIMRYFLSKLDSNDHLFELKTFTRLIHLYVRKGYDKCIQPLFENMDKQSTAAILRKEENQDLILFCAQEGYFDLLKLLVSHGLYTDAVDDENQNALHWAYALGHTELGTWLDKRTNRRLRRQRDNEDRLPDDSNTDVHAKNLDDDTTMKQHHEKNSTGKEKLSVHKDIPLSVTMDPPVPPSVPTKAKIAGPTSCEYNMENPKEALKHSLNTDKAEVLVREQHTEEDIKAPQIQSAKQELTNDNSEEGKKPLRQWEKDIDEIEKLIMKERAELEELMS